MGSGSTLMGGLGQCTGGSGSEEEEMVTATKLRRPGLASRGGGLKMLGMGRGLRLMLMGFQLKGFGLRESCKLLRRRKINGLKVIITLSSYSTHLGYFCRLGCLA